MTLVNLFFFAHQPERLRPYGLRPQDARTPATIHRDLFDEEMDATIFRKVAGKCYYPATRMLLEMIEEHRHSDKPFRVSFGLSGTFIEQAQRFEPELIRIFQRLAGTGMVEFTGETYYHSLASLWFGDRREFRRQVELHSETIERLFGQRPTVFRNTECLYNNEIAEVVQSMGFRAIMTEGVDWLMEGWRSPDFLYQSTSGLPVLLRNYRYSDDIGYRFPNQSWEHWPLSAEKFAGWCASNTDEIINLMIDYEALGEHIWAETGIFDFIRYLPQALRTYPQLAFTTPGAAVATLPVRGTISVGPYETISWADMERDTSAWLRNEMQQFCFEELRQMEGIATERNEAAYLHAWRLLQTSDHLYYLCDKSLSDGDVHTYFSAYGTLFESFVRLQTAITDLKSAMLYERSTSASHAPLPEAVTAGVATATESLMAEDTTPRRTTRSRAKATTTPEESEKPAPRTRRTKTAGDTPATPVDPVNNELAPQVRRPRAKKDATQN